MLQEVGIITLEFIYLVGGLEHDWIMTFHLLGMSSSQLTNLYVSEGLKPPTNIYMSNTLLILDFIELVDFYVRLVYFTGMNCVGQRG
jgi:hypothetical protein